MAEKDVLRPVYAVGPGLCGDVDDAGFGTTHFRRIFVCRDLKLTDSIFREVHQGPAHHFVVVVRAIDDNVAASSVRSPRRNLQRDRLSWVKAWCRPVARNQKRQL